MRKSNKYYLDIEPTGLDPKKDKIIAIQYQQLEKSSARPSGRILLFSDKIKP